MEWGKHIPSLWATAERAQLAGSFLLYRNLSSKNFGPVFAQSIIDRRGHGIGFVTGALVSTTINSGETAQVAL